MPRTQATPTTEEIEPAGSGGANGEEEEENPTPPGDAPAGEPPSGDGDAPPPPPATSRATPPTKAEAKIATLEARLEELLGKVNEAPDASGVRSQVAAILKEQNNDTKIDNLTKAIEALTTLIENAEKSSGRAPDRLGDFLHRFFWKDPRR
jgi:hypothetical protein